MSPTPSPDSAREPATPSQPPRRLSSSRNPALKEVRALQAKKVRRDRRLFVVEGEDLLDAARAADVTPKAVVVDAEKVAEDDPRLTGLPEATEIYLVPTELMEGVSTLAAPPRIVAVLPQPGPWGFAEVPIPPSPGVYLAGVGDPGNVGTIVRSAAALGADWLGLAPGSADPYHPKAVRAAMGATFSLPVLPGVRPHDLATRGPLRTIGAAAEGGKPPWEVDLTGPLVLILGSEREGLRDLPSELTPSEVVTIPQAPGAESLNVAAAASALLTEIVRQRS